MSTSWRQIRKRRYVHIHNKYIIVVSNHHLKDLPLHSASQVKQRPQITAIGCRMKQPGYPHHQSSELFNIN